MIKKIGSKERRKVNDILQISKEVVDEAKEIGAIIAIGYPKGLRKENRCKNPQ